MEKIPILILAAGSSERLGQPKQLLTHTDNSLLHYTVSEALKTTKKVIVVLGFHAEVIEEEMKNLPVKFLRNKEWKEGMASSIRCGLSFLLEEEPQLNALIIMVSDQPFVSAPLLYDILKKYQETKKQIVACSYKDTVGVPALFDRSLFDDLLHLSGQSGAKRIIAQYMNRVEAIAFPLGYIDIDTQEDYEAFKTIQSSK